MTTRILHIVGGMNRGGVESWLMHVLRNIDRKRFKMDFLVHTQRPCAYDDEIRAMGSEIIPCLHPSRPWVYASNFLRILRECGPFDVVHSHVHHFSGFVLKLARRAGVPMRIAHSHSDTISVESKSHPLRLLYLRLTERWVARHATLGLAASPKAATSLFGPNWRACSNRRVLYCGIDLPPFQVATDRAVVREEMGIPSDAFVVGHVGRFHEPKNHIFLLEIASVLARVQSNMRLLLVGDGPLRSRIERKIIELGLAKKTILAGVRPDVPIIMLGCMDVFAFPSLYEGLGLVVVEAQAAGLPCVISNAVPEDADLVKPLVRRMALDQSAPAWAQALIDSRSNAIAPSEAIQILEKSPFRIEACISELEKIYNG